MGVLASNASNRRKRGSWLPRECVLLAWRQLKWKSRVEGAEVAVPGAESEVAVPGAESRGTRGRKSRYQGAEVAAVSARNRGS